MSEIQEKAIALDGVAESKQMSLLIRIIYFVFIGWWFGLIMANIAWILCVIVIGLPLGINIFNHLPYLITLKKSEEVQTVNFQTSEGDQQSVQIVRKNSMLVRTLYFVFIGWWFSLFWIWVAYSFMVSIFGMPVAFMMINRIPLIITLKR